ncbi:heme NO-binding domain-containing protein [Halopiger goleimassiliensis]|uniref:heme NO-binding domain-containing protein n=1 Tax=Halopiger goleimassiliensis TaxID=1293048 RepID=UPI0006782AF2|nr:heme NO-binding domain-containing protein [Halopiger goleimassiliensis]
MHGIVHKTLEEYVVDRSDEDTWEAILEQADVEATLYLPVSFYDDAELEAILASLSEMAVQDRRQIERGFGRRLAPELLSTFGAHVADDWTLLELLAEIDEVVADVDAATAETSLPAVSGHRDGDEVVVTYRSERPYCAIAHGVLLGLTDAADATATVSKLECVDDGADACTFRVSRDDGE